jgi:hypothetical protein
MLSSLRKDTFRSHLGPKSTQLLGRASPTTIIYIYIYIANCGLHDALARLAEALVDRFDRWRHQ